MTAQICVQISVVSDVVTPLQKKTIKKKNLKKNNLMNKNECWADWILFKKNKKWNKTVPV